MTLSLDKVVVQCGIVDFVALLRRSMASPSTRHYLSSRDMTRISRSSYAIFWLAGTHCTLAEENSIDLFIIDRCGKASWYRHATFENDFRTRIERANKKCVAGDYRVDFAVLDEGHTR